MTATVTTLPDRSPLPFDPALPPTERSRMLAAALPDALRDVLATGTVERRSRFADDGFSGVCEIWQPPATVTSRHAAVAQRVLDDFERTVLAPAEPNHLLARILALLSHFPAKGMTPEVEQMVALDWADDLGEFPAWAIDQAARTWRRSRKWRPSIAEMRALCEEACAQERSMAGRLRAIARAGATAPEEGRGPVYALRRMP
ncbi:MAG TPA: hypothetical protein VD978_15595 [Azospirillum sp.]|nr:hypothetical protein [Azospirillum sp.]